MDTDVTMTTHQTTRRSRMPRVAKGGPGDGGSSGDDGDASDEPSEGEAEDTWKDRTDAERKAYDRAGFLQEMEDSVPTQVCAVCAELKGRAEIPEQVYDPTDPLFAVLKNSGCRQHPPCLPGSRVSIRDGVQHNNLYTKRQYIWQHKENHARLCYIP
jgi:hypothetical protein